MPINVTAVPTLPDHVNDVRLRTAAIVNDEILPREAELWPRGRGAMLSEDGRARAHDAPARRSARRCATPGSGRRTCRRSTAGWGSTSSPTPT